MTPFFSLTDAEGRLRVWLLLPPAYLLLGIAHFWLSSMPRAAGGGGVSRAGPAYRDPRDS